MKKEWLTFFCETQVAQILFIQLMKFRLLFLSILCCCCFTHAQVVINEIMSNNRSTKVDEDNNFSDWVELYNTSVTTLNLQGYFLSDNPDSLQKWKIPSIIIQPDSFINIWCSGKNDTLGNNIHTNFSLDSQGENVFLSDPNGNVIDNFSALIIVPDKTYGRLPDGNNNQVFLSIPTFKSTNNVSGIFAGTINTPPVFSLPGGFYSTAQQLFLTHPDSTVVIHYTLDGSDPTENSPVYLSPINLQSRIGEPNYYSMIRTCFNVHFYLPDWHPPLNEVFKSNIVRAGAFKSGYYPSPVQTHSYFIDPDIFNRYGNMPVVSLVSDPKNLFNDTTGIYVPGINYQPNTFLANYYLDWDRPANIEMYLPGGINAFNSNFKISINGQSSPSSPQKGLNVNASSDYGASKIEYPLFENTTGVAKYIQKFDKIKLRAWGSDREKTLFRDAYCASFMRKSNLDYEAYQPVVVFINGEYWGLQEMRERNRNGSYYQSHYLIDEKNPGFDILDGSGNTIIEGDAVHWNSMIDFVNTNPLSNPLNYYYIKTQLDVNSFMLKYMNSIYFCHGDWPGQNEGKWRPKIAGGRWKWMQWDMDNAAGYYLMPWYDMFPLVTSGARGLGPSVMLNNLLLSTEFKNDFINLFADYLNTEYLPDIAQGRVDEMRDEILPYMNEFQNRWQLNYNWQNDLNDIKVWVSLRPEYCKQQILNHFSLPTFPKITLDVSDTSMGNVKVSTLLLDDKTTRVTQNTYPWEGQYFSGVPVPLKAIAKPGFKFVEWLPSNNTDPEVLVNITIDTALTAVFDIDPGYQFVFPPVINEVMSSNLSVIADTHGEFDDWMEIYNPGSDTLDLAGYFLTDNLVLPTRFQIAQGTSSSKIPPHGFLLLWIDDDPEQGILHTNFKFNSTGDFIALISPDGETIVDSLHIPVLAQDISWGRSYDASPQFISFSPSTPNATNRTFSGEIIYINELQTNNSATIPDNHNDYDQWIELYNPTSNIIDLAGWKISNDVSMQTYYTIPHFSDSTKIIPGGFKILWADNETYEGSTHLNFVLQQTGCIYLATPNDTTVDYICYGAINQNQSFGRFTDGHSNWIIFPIPTPDNNNILIIPGINDLSTDFDLQIYPNPVWDKIYFNRFISFRLFDLLGRELFSVENVSSFDMSKLDAGIYLIYESNGHQVRFLKR